MAYQRVHAYGLLTYTCGVLSTWAYVLWDFVLWAFVRVGFCPDTDLHWLPVRQRIVFKLCSIVSKCLHRTAPSYLTDLCTPVSATTARTRLRSSSRGDLRLIIPRSRLSRYGSRSFAVCGPAAWNSLPVAVRDLSSSASSFCHHLKTELFSRAYGVFPP